MTTGNGYIRIVTLACVVAFAASTAHAQRFGAMDSGSIEQRILLSNGPKGPIHGGESAVSGMMLMGDGWVYGATEATYGAEACHLFRTDGSEAQHLLNITLKLRGQTKVTGIACGPGGTIIGGTGTYDEVYETKASYDGGHLFSYDTKTRAFVDHGVVMAGQGINCVAVDTLHTRIYCVTYPAGHLFSYDYASKTKKDYGQIMNPWRVKDLDQVSWRGVPKVLMIDDAGTVYFSTYFDEGRKADDQGDPFLGSRMGGRILRLAYGDEKPVFTGATVPTQKGMHNDPIYENTIVCAVKARDGGFWCGTSVDGFLFKFYPSTSTVVNYGKAFNYWNLRSLAYGGDGNLYMLGGRDYDNTWLLKFDVHTRSMESLGWPNNTTQCGVICANKDGGILIAENMRNSYIYVYGESK